MATTTPEELGQRLYAFLRGESDQTPEEIVTEDFRGHLTDGLPLGLGGDYPSREDMIGRGWGRVGTSFDMRPEVEEFYPVDDSLLIGRGHYVGSSVTHGKPVRAAFAHFWGITDGRFSSVYQVTDSAAWEHALQ